MARLWRYWPVRMVGGWIFMAPVVGLGMLCGYGLASGRIALGLGALGAAVLWGVGCGAGLKRIDRAAGLAPLRDQTRNNQLRAIGLMILPAPLFVTGSITLNVLFPDPQSLSYLARMLCVLLAMFPPFLFAANAWPRTWLQWMALVCCIPALHAASLAAPIAAAAMLRSLVSGNPGMAATLGASAIALIAFNAPFAILLTRSGACPLKFEAAGTHEEMQP